jgi:hypothetical protein
MVEQMKAPTSSPTPSDRMVASLARRARAGVTGADASSDPALAAAERIARVMDGWYVDPLLGLFLPWAGDVIGAGLGLYPVILAWRRGAPKGLLARMLLNLSVDLLGGAVPVVGDIWDFFFRANSRNLALLKSRMAGTAVANSPRDRWVVAGAALVFLAALALPVGLLVAAIVALSHRG